MININLNDVQEYDGGGFMQLEPGGYILRVIGIEHNMAARYVRLLWDVAEGDYKDIYKASEWPPADILSYKERALGMLKHKLACLSESNLGFDAQTAFINEDWGVFQDKVFGAVVRRRMYTTRTGDTGTGVEIGRWHRVSEIREGAFKLMPPRDARNVNPQPKVETKPLADDDIPF